jgi:hypothetical protein
VNETNEKIADKLLNRISESLAPEPIDSGLNFLEAAVLRLQIERIKDPSPGSAFW